MVIESKFCQDLQKPVMINRLHGFLFTGDNGGNKITVTITDGGEPVSLSGTLRGYVIRPDGETVQITNGTISGSSASVVLPASCYEIPGNVTIVLKVDNVTVCACSAVVKQAMTNDMSI